MANIPLKSIKFPGLDDTYTVPQVDADLDTTGAAADAKATGDALTEINERLGDLSDLDTQDKSSLVAAINEAAQSGGSVDPEAITEAVDEWLEEHPEATTTVEDGSITFPKLADHVIDYITPEMYGAKGDATADDTTALQNCINAARSQNRPVRGFGRYKTTAPITISGTYQDIEIERITYTGNQSGIILTGSYNTLKMAQLYCGSGKGLVMQRSSSSASCSWNRVTITRLFADGHAVDFDNDSQYFILYNTFDIRFIKSDTGNCYNMTDAVTENIYLNSTCSCPSGWAIYGGHGRFYNFTLESDVLNGIYGTNGYFSGFRYRELADKVVYRINGSQPDIQGGTLIKFIGWGGHLYFKSDDPIPYEAIDVSDMDTPDDIAHASTSIGYAAPGLAQYNIIDAPIIYGDWDTKNGYVIPGKRMIVVGQRKICVPAYETIYEITESDYDMRDSEVVSNDAKIYPTKMVIGVDDCVIHLPASYCPYGYSEFIVDQTHGHLCTIFDYNDDVNPAFDGSALGSGVYRLKSYCGPTENALTELGYDQVLNDSKNYSWEITRIDTTEGSAGTSVICVDDFGAVGDGETDDSEAVQAAVDAGYDIYFSSNKTYYIPTQIEIDHDIHLYGGENTTLKAAVQNGQLNDIFVISGTLKKTTTLTTDYTQTGNTANSGNRFTLSDMTGISIGDLMVITATDQYYNYSRRYYYLGGTLLIGDIYDGHLFATCDLPFDIENTENVSVQIFDAPVAIIENLNFVGDLSGRGHYKQMIRLEYCKNSIVRNCNLSHMDNGITLRMCSNTLIESVELSKAKELNSQSGDSYGVMIFSSTDTIVQRVNAICAQSCVCLTGSITCINTYVRNCNLCAESRGNAVGSHENSYNTVIEDCTLSGLNVLGTAIVNRCRFIQNNRVDYNSAITFCGSHNPDYAILKVKDCVFEGNRQIYLYSSSPQEPIQSYDSVIGLIEVVDCEGGTLVFSGTISETILSNSIKEMNLIRWRNCREFYRPSTEDVVEKLTVVDCTFRERFWVNDHNDSHGIILTNIYDLDFSSTIPMVHKKCADKDIYAEKYTLPENVPINLSSDNQTATFIVCGNNLASDDPDDYVIGSVSGSDGGTLTRTKATGSIPTITKDASGNIVYTQQNNTSGYSMYPVGLFLVNEPGMIRMSATIKNTGSTDPATFRPYIAVVDCETGKLVSRYTGTEVQATSQGAEMSFSKPVNIFQKKSVAMCYLYCNAPVANAQTTFENYSVVVENTFTPSAIESIQPYEAKRRIGDGAILSLRGVNNIMCSELNFHVNFGVDYIENPL